MENFEKKKKRIIALIDGPSILREGYKLSYIDSLLNRTGEPSKKLVYLSRHTGEQLIRAVGILGYQPVPCETDSIDPRLIRDATSYIIENEKYKNDVFVLGSSKFDFFPLICLAKDKGLETLVFFHSEQYSEALKNVAHKYKILEEETGKNEEIIIIEEGKEKILLFLDVPNILRGNVNLSTIDDLVKKEGIPLIKKAYSSRHVGEGLTLALSMNGYEPRRCETDDVDPTLITDATFFIDNNKEIHHATIFGLVSGDSDFCPLLHRAKDEGLKTLVLSLPSNNEFGAHSSEALKNYADIYRLIEPKANQKEGFKPFENLLKNFKPGD